jgi:ubiquitin-conjugating enzyme E2 Z
MSTFISKETIQRLLKDVKYIIKNPLTEQGIYYIHDDTDMLKGYAMIVGPSDTPYFGGFYFFEFTYPTDYPHSPPKVKYCTNGYNIRFNPNLYCCGKVCISLLNTWKGDQWTSCQTISTVLLTLCTLLCSDPLLNEPGVNKEHTDMNNYTSIIEVSNLSIAVCDIVSKKKGVYLPFFDNFYPFVKEIFNNNYAQLLEFSQKRLAETFTKPTNITTEFYSMNVCVNYTSIIKKLQTTKQMLELSTA